MTAPPPTAKIKFGLNIFGGLFINTTGALTLLDILIKSGFKNVDLLGADFDFFRTAKYNSIKELAMSSFMCSLSYYELSQCKAKYAKNKLLKINNLSINSVYNLN